MSDNKTEIELKLALDSKITVIFKLINYIARKIEEENVNDAEINDLIIDLAQQWDIIDIIELKIPGWKKMSSFKQGATLIHVFRVFIALLNSPEYQNATLKQKFMLKWIILLHDLGKELVEITGGKTQRDDLHPFKSTAMAARILYSIGFPITENYHNIIKKWTNYTMNAVQRISNSNQEIEYLQDNRKLPEITEGIELMFRKNTPATSILKTILFHQSFNVIKEWSSPSPLNDMELKKFIDLSLLKLLEATILSDSASWQPFCKPVYREEIKSRFNELEQQFNYLLATRLSILNHIKLKNFPII